MAKTYTSSPADDELRREVALTILRALSQDANFGEPKEFARWTRAHKLTLVSLFSGRGIVNLARVVAFLRREALQRRNPEPEVFCLLVAGLHDGSVPELVREGLLSMGIATVPDLLVAAMVDLELASSLFRKAPVGGLEAL